MSTVLLRRIFLLLCVVGVSAAALADSVVWQGDDPNNPTLWNVAENWNSGSLPTSETNDIAKFLGTDDFCEVVAGDDFTIYRTWICWGDDKAHLKVHSGGSLTTTSWMGVGIFGGGEALLEIDGGTVLANGHRQSRHGSTLENLNDSTTLINSGTYTVTGNASLGEEHVGTNFPGIARIIMNGGTMTVGGNLTSYDINIASNGVSPNVVVDLNDGVLDIGGMSGSFEGNPDKIIDIDFGTWIIDGDVTTGIDAMITAGELIGFGGLGTVNYNYDVTNAGKTTVTATHPLNPDPVHKGFVLINGGTAILSWDNYVDPNHAGAAVIADVWFGTDPNKANPAGYTKIVDGQVVTPGTRGTSPAQAIADGVTYYWQVDFDNGSGSLIEGPVFEFFATDNAPPQVSVKNVTAWLDEGTGVAVIPLDATVIDDPAYTHAWTLDPAGDPNVAFDDTAIEDPTLTIDATGEWTVTLTVDDGFWVESASAQVVVGENPCDAARQGDPNYQGDLVGDLTDDCATDIQDLLILVEAWLDDVALTGILYY